MNALANAATCQRCCRDGLSTYLATLCRMPASCRFIQSSPCNHEKKGDQIKPRFFLFCTHGDAASGRTNGAACSFINSANTPRSLGAFPSDIRAPSIGPSGFGGSGDRVGVRFEDAAYDAFWGADSCEFAGSRGSTVGGVCEELELQGSHPIFPSNDRVMDSKMLATWTCAMFCDGKWP